MPPKRKVKNSSDKIPPYEKLMAPQSSPKSSLTKKELEAKIRKLEEEIVSLNAMLSRYARAEEDRERYASIMSG